MDERKYTRIIIRNGQSTLYYSEQEAAQYSHLEVTTIRRLQAVGLIEGVEVPEGERRYSEDDVAQLRRIRRLQRDLGVNLAGVEVILRLCARLETLQRELERYK